MYPRSEILFPRRCVPRLRTLLDRRWTDLVDHVLAQNEDCEDGLAFSLMMIQLCGCLNCEMGGYKASLGCDICSQRAIESVKDGSRSLEKRFEDAREMIRTYLEHGRLPVEEPEATAA